MPLSDRRSIGRGRITPPLILLYILLIAITLTGGTSRADSLAQPLVRGAAAAALIACALLPWPWRGRELRGAFIGLGALAALMLVQLIPLPPGIWASLPGRAFYLEGLAAAGLDPQWRPIALVPERGWNSLFALLVPLAVLAALAFLSSRRRASLTLAVWVMALASAVLGLAQLSGGAGSALRWYLYSSDAYATGFFANRNHQALLVAAALPALAAWATVPNMRSEARRLRFYIGLAVAVFVILMLPTTGSRAGIALAVIGAVAAIAMAWTPARRAFKQLSRRMRRRALAIGAAGVVALVGVLVVYGRNDAIARLYGLSIGDDVRAQALPTILAMTREFFPLGTGFGAFDLVFRRFEPFAMLSNSYLNQAHNDIVQAVLEGGVVAALLMLAAAAWWAVATVRAWRAQPSAERQAARAGSAILLMCAVASAFDYPLRTPLAMALAAIAAAWLLTPDPRWSEDEADAEPDLR